MDTIGDIKAYILSESILAYLESLIADKLTIDPVHDLEHAHRVAFWTWRIVPNTVSKTDAVAAALCHDVVYVAKNSPDRPNASLLSADASRDILKCAGFIGESIDLIAEAIVDHSFSHGSLPKSDLGKALQDADRLDALGAIGIIRSASTATQLGIMFYDPEDTWGERRTLNDHKFMLDHYFTKLLTLPETMCTDAGRQEALRRVLIMKDFLLEISRELSIDNPCLAKLTNSHSL